jgi:hypothetical protein
MVLRERGSHMWVALPNALVRCRNRELVILWARATGLDQVA